MLVVATDYAGGNVRMVKGNLRMKIRRGHCRDVRGKGGI